MIRSINFLLTSGLPAGQTLRFLLVFLMPLQTLCAQNNALRGKILFLSSGKTPAIGVEISGTIKQGEQANTVYTTDLGAYQLVFPTAGEGQRVNLVIGDRDAGNTQLELVNEKEVQGCRIPLNATEEFEIIVAKKGSRDLVAQKYYKIIKTSADIALAQTKKQLDQLFQQQQKDYEQIAQMSDRIQKLEQQSDSLGIYKEAFRIASINKDNASDRLLTYIELLDEGKSIQEAREVLSIQNAAEDLNKGLRLFESAIEELQTRAQASVNLYDYQDAIMCYDTIISYSEKLGIEQKKLALYFEKIATIHRLDGQYNRSVDFFSKSIEIQKKLPQQDSQALANIFHLIAFPLKNLGKYELALHYQEQTLAIDAEIMNPNDANWGYHYLGIGGTYKHLGKYEKALMYMKKGAKMLESISGANPLVLASGYNNIGVIYSILRADSISLVYYQKALEIEERNPDANKDFLASTYNNVGEVYFGLGKYYLALEYQQKAIGLLESILHPSHPHLATLYRVISLTYTRLGEYEKAESFVQKAIGIQEELFDPYHPDLADSYNSMGNFYREIGRSETALTFHHKAVDIQEKILDSTHTHLASSYNLLSIAYRDIGENEKALEFQLKDISILKSNFGPKHPDLAGAYNSIGIGYYQLKKYKEALRYQQLSLDIRKEILDPNHSDIAGTLYSMANTYVKLNQAQKALTTVTKALEIWQSGLANNHPKIGMAYIGLARALFHLQSFPEAFEAHRKCVEIFQISLPADHPFQLSAFHIGLEIYENRAMAAYEKQEYASVLADMDTVLTHADSSYESLANVWSYKGLSHLQIAEFTQAYDAFKEVQNLSPDDPLTYRNWALYHAAQDHPDQSLANLQHAVDLGYHDLEWLESQIDLTNLRDDRRFKKLQKQIKHKQSESPD